MNKLELDKENIINICIDKDTICNINKEYNINELNIELKDNVKFIINHYSEIDKSELKIDIIENNNSLFLYNHSFISKEDYNVYINVKMIGNKSKNTINIHGISDGGKSSVIIDGKVNENTIDNELDENIKLLNINNGTSNIYPNMYIDTKNVSANHSASISLVNEDYIFYLMSKGINRENSIRLILDGFLNNEAR